MSVVIIITGKGNVHINTPPYFKPKRQYSVGSVSSGPQVLVKVKQVIGNFMSIDFEAGSVVW